MDISVQPVKHFLDSVDSVLNSNTFIVEFEAVHPDPEESVRQFLDSGDFTEQLVQQDRERDWYMFSDPDKTGHCFRIRPGSLLESIPSLTIGYPACDKREYLIGMLTGDTSKGSFFSFYRKEKSRKEAEIIVDNLTAYLSSYSGEWDLFTIKPDFLKRTGRTYPKGENLKYFEGDFANDTATLIRHRDKVFLILTNGID